MSLTNTHKVREISTQVASLIFWEGAKKFVWGKLGRAAAYITKHIAQIIKK